MKDAHGGGKGQRNEEETQRERERREEGGPIKYFAYLNRDLHSFAFLGLFLAQRSGKAEQE